MGDVDIPTKGTAIGKAIHHAEKATGAPGHVLPVMHAQLATAWALVAQSLPNEWPTKEPPRKRGWFGRG